MVNDLLTNLRDNVRWETAFRTFGNNHCSLIGLLVDWWIHSDLRREALEAPPWYASKAEKGGASDAILMEDGICMGIVEAEGTAYSKAIDRMVKHIVSENQYWRLEFGILLAYPTKKTYMENPLPMDEFVEKCKKVTEKHQIQLVVLALDKRWDPQTKGPRTRGPRSKKN